MAFYLNCWIVELWGRFTDVNGWNIPPTRHPPWFYYSLDIITRKNSLADQTMTFNGVYHKINKHVVTFYRRSVGIISQAAASPGRDWFGRNSISNRDWWSSAFCALKTFKCILEVISYLWSPGEVSKIYFWSVFLFDTKNNRHDRRKKKNTVLCKKCHG
jgi:hypothetical protein